MHIFVSKIGRAQSPFTTLLIFNLISGDGSDGTEVQYEPGFRLGVEKDGKMYVNNHLKFIMSYHKTPPSSEGSKDNYRVVGFRVETGSVDHRCDHC